MLRPLVNAVVLSQRSLEQSVAHLLAGRVTLPACISPSQWQPFFEVVKTYMIVSFKGAPFWLPAGLGRVRYTRALQFMLCV